MSPLRSLVLCACLLACGSGARAAAGDGAGDLLQHLIPPTRYNSTLQLRCPPRAHFDVPASCKSKETSVLCKDCIDAMAAAALPALPKTYPCDTPPSFIISCIVPYMPAFQLGGGNASGLGNCNKDEIAERMVKQFKCAGPGMDPKRLAAAFSTIALGESGGRSAVVQPQEYGLQG